MLRNFLRWARVSGPANNAQQFSAQQVEYLSKVADAVMLFPYGIHANVPADFLALIASVQDNPDNRVAIGVLPKVRPDLAQGEVAFYHPPTGGFIIWRNGGNLDAETGNDGAANANLKVGDFTIDGNLIVTGSTTLSATVTSDGKDISDTHKHGGSATAPTGPITDTGAVV